MTQGNPWGPYLAERFQLLNIVMLPLFTILICTLVAQIEHRNKTWKQVLASPQRKSTIFFSKYAMVLLLIILFLVLHNVLLFAVTSLVDSRASNVWFKFHKPDWDILIDYNIRTIICIQGISALQILARDQVQKLYYPYLHRLLLVATLAATLTLELRLPRADLHPYAYPIYAIFKEFEWKLPILFAGSAGYAVSFLLLGFFDFSRRSLKE